MIPTRQYIKELFGTFNTAYFGGELPEPEFAISNARTILGQFCCSQRRSLLPWRQKPERFTIKVTRYYDMPERECQNILLHEMIHFYITYKGIRDTSPHGRAFRSMMDSLNKGHGWGIRVRTDSSKWALAGGPKRKQRLVLALQTTEGKCLFAVVNRKYYAAINRQAKMNRHISAYRWVETDSEAFRDYPVSRTLRGRIVSRAAFEGTLNEIDKRGATNATSDTVARQ